MKKVSENNISNDRNLTKDIRNGTTCFSNDGINKMEQNESTTSKVKRSKDVHSDNNDYSNNVTDDNCNENNEPILSVEVCNIGRRCPFGNQEMIQFELFKGGCVWIQGSSGRGKTTLAMHIAGIFNNSNTTRTNQNLVQTHDIYVKKLLWSPKIPIDERCGVLFQQTTLLDELTIAGNLCIALDRSKHYHFASIIERNHKIKQLIELVGLNYVRDANKRCSQLSGGMSRRASLAVQLAQCKHVIVLDEPFTGLDHTTAISIIHELIHIRNTVGTAFILITHQYDLAELLMNGTITSTTTSSSSFSDDAKTKDTTSSTRNRNVIVHLDEPLNHFSSSNGNNTTNRIVQPKKLNLYGTTMTDRFMERLFDYIIWSLPLILLTFTATGLAISMLSADTLNRIDVTKYVLEIVDTEIRPIITFLTGNEPNTLTMLGVRMKVNSMLQSTIPPAKSKLYAIGFTKLMLLEVGPLLTGLLLTGRIGGSYAGKVATMHSTQQILLLQTIGISSCEWIFVPSYMASIIAAPLLTIFGTYVSIVLGGYIAPQYNIGTYHEYWDTVYTTTFPPLRLQSFSPSFIASPLFLPYFYRYLYDTLIEIITWPPIFHTMKAIVFMSITILVAEYICNGRRRSSHYKRITARTVPTIITSSVVVSGLLIICADWGFSQLWLLRK